MRSRAAIGAACSPQQLQPRFADATDPTPKFERHMENYVVCVSWNELLELVITLSTVMLASITA